MDTNQGKRNPEPELLGKNEQYLCAKSEEIERKALQRCSSFTSSLLVLVVSRATD